MFGGLGTTGLRMEWPITVGVVLCLALTGWHGVRTKDWRPLAAALVAGFIGLISGFCISALVESATPDYTFYVGGVSMIVSCAWWRIHANSWHAAWDRVVSWVGSLEMGISIIILVAALLVGIFWLAR